jgi:hypothetical protein
MMQRYIPSEHAPAPVDIPTPRIKTPAVKRKRYESIKTIKTQSRGHDALLREHCTPSTRTRREIRWLTTETPNRWRIALTIVLWPGGIVIYPAHTSERTEREGGVYRWRGVFYTAESASRALIENGGKE